MSYVLKATSHRLLIVALVCSFCLLTGSASAQFAGFRNTSVGGVKIDVDGVVSNPETAELKEMQSAWQSGLQAVPTDLQAATELRFVSLSRLEAQIAEARAKGVEIPDAVRYLAGLTRVKYVLAYPEQHDVVLAGPAEGWRVDARGNVVGAATGRPTLTLDDLMVALRVAEQANISGISCSIDPTPEGMRRMAQISGKLSARGGPEAAGRVMEEAVGPQTITVTGVPATSHLARVIVAADFRMKRLAMGFEPAPVQGMPSFLTMAGRSGGRLQSMMPRFWLAPNYEPLRRDADSLTWELRGDGVKCMTEQQFLSNSGERVQMGKTDPIAQKWADAFTANFDELAREDSTFGQLRNVMDLAVVAALVTKEGMFERTGIQIPLIRTNEPLNEYPAPRQVASQASFVKAGRNWVISVSGGVQIYPWQIADRTEVVTDLASTRGANDKASATSWYWQR